MIRSAKRSGDDILCTTELIRLEFIVVIVKILSEIRCLAGYENVIILDDLDLTQLAVLIGVRLLYQMVGLCLVLVVVLWVYPHLNMSYVIRV